MKDTAISTCNPATPVPAVLRRPGPIAQLIRFAHPEANQPAVIWTVPRELFTLVREIQPGYSGIVSNIWALTYGPQNREYGWTQISPLGGPFSLDLWDQGIGEFFAQLSLVVSGTALGAIQLRTEQ